MVEIESLRPGVVGKGGKEGGVFERFGDTWTKLRAFELVEYEVSRQGLASNLSFAIPGLTLPTFRVRFSCSAARSLDGL